MLKWAVGREEREWSSRGKRRRLTSISDKDTPPWRNASLQHPRNANPAKKDPNSEESTSLLYMTLDHLPLAILRQTDKMLEEAAQLGPRQVATVPTRRPTEHAPSTKQNGNKLQPQIDPPLIRQAHNRCLKVSGPTVIRHRNLKPPKPKLISPEEFNERNAVSSGSSSTSTTDNSTSGPIVPKFQTTNLKSATLPNRGKPKWKWNPPPINERLGNREPFQCLHNKNNPAVDVDSLWHDTTDPQFLETSVAYTSPPKPKSARKCTLKRSEIRKLERLGKETERLNRFLKKYYHDCLPIFPEEEDFSPEEKSLLWKVSNYSDSSTSSGSSSGSSSSAEPWTTPKRPSTQAAQLRMPTLLPMIQEDAEVSSSVSVSEIESMRDVSVAGSHLFKASPLAMERSPLPNHWNCTLTPPQTSLQLPLEPDLDFSNEIYCKLSARGVGNSAEPFEEPLADCNEPHEESPRLDFQAETTAGEELEPMGDIPNNSNPDYDELDSSSEPSPKVSPRKKVVRRLNYTPKKVVLRSPKKCVRKPNLNLVTPFTHKGEVLIRTYTNGGYVTLHVVEAKNLQVSYRSSWKLAIKISVLPEAEETLTRSEAVLVKPNQSTLQIDQKFSFEKAERDPKVFLTFWKRREKFLVLVTP